MRSDCALCSRVMTTTESLELRLPTWTPRVQVRSSAHAKLRQRRRWDSASLKPRAAGDAIDSGANAEDTQSTDSLQCAFDLDWDAIRKLGPQRRLPIRSGRSPVVAKTSHSTLAGQQID